MLQNNETLVPRVSLEFTRLNVFAFIAFLRNVVAMTGKAKAKYSAPNPPLDALTNGLNELDVLANDARGRGKYQVVARDAKRKEVTLLAKQLAAYVQNNCGDNVVAILDSGFNAVRRGSKMTEMLPPRNPRLARNANSGILEFRFSGSLNAANYTIQTATNAAGPWTDEGLSTKTNVRLTDRVPGTIYFARTRANGAPGVSEWTVPVSAMAV